MVEEKEKVSTEINKLKTDISNLDAKYNKEKISSQKKDELLSYASKLSLSNFVLRSFKVRSNGKEVETDKASKIDRIKVSFDINENLLANSGEKKIYMVIKKPTGETVTFTNRNSGVFTYNNKKTLFSDSSTFNYDKDKMQTLEFVWDSEDFSRGDYVMEIYEQNKQDALLIGKVTKSLQ